ncbi:MAG TPA: serine hydrolase domain-containing protein [Candidatus Limnocylindria bacterium]|nr:serine hydrolase domain-containing protein [Candidatus Limnocylindria bacterium]
MVDAAAGTLFTACVVRLERKGHVETYAAGTLCPDPSAPPDAPCTEDAIFDLASLTKLATTALVLSLVRERALSLETPLRELVPDFRGGRKDDVTLRHVLTHTAGLTWWLPLHQEIRSIDEAVWRAAQEPLAQDLGTFTYSDLGYIMLTGGLANAGDEPFDELVAERVVGPIEAGRLAFGPREPAECVATEIDPSEVRGRIRGTVHDENAFAMGGVAGHAGLFGTAADVAAIARVFRDGAVIGNDLAALARTEHAKGDNVRRGLGLALRAPNGPMTSDRWSLDSYGHTGFTGTSLWIDPTKELTVVLLTNRVYFGRKNDDAMYRFRIAVHEAAA